METVAVLDFETTGLAPNWGDRATEIAIAMVRDGKVVDRFQSLMNAGRCIPAEIIRLTGITNEMIARAPSAADVMRDAAHFVGHTPLVAHNAAFDKKFWEAELARVSLRSVSRFACTLLLARRIYPDSPNHRLATLIQRLRLPNPGRAHRAMVDAEMTGDLWCRIQQDVGQRYAIHAVDHQLLTQVQRTSHTQVAELLRTFAGVAARIQTQ